MTAPPSPPEVPVMGLYMNSRETEYVVGVLVLARVLLDDGISDVVASYLIKRLRVTLSVLGIEGAIELHGRVLRGAANAFPSAARAIADVYAMPEARRAAIIDQIMKDLEERG
jgi:hypothetical protein